MKKKAEIKKEEVQPVTEQPTKRGRRPQGREEAAVNKAVKGFHKNVWMLKKELKHSSNPEMLVQKFTAALSKLNDEVEHFIRQVELEARVAAMTDEEKAELKKMLNA